MEIVFNCPKCDQELQVDAQASGSQIDCPSCSNPLTIPAPDAEGVHQTAASAGVPQESSSPPPEPAPAAKDDGPHFSVRSDYHHSDVLVDTKKKTDEDASASSGEKQIRVKTIRRVDCVEVGKDHFDEIVTKFLGKVGEENIVSITPVSYTTLDISTQKLLVDYGSMIVYKG